MIAEILERCDAVEECYEFMLGYAAQGVPDDDRNPEVRECLNRAVSSLDGLADACEIAAGRDWAAFLEVLRRDADDSLALLRLVLAQAKIGSQLIDNLNASIHVRALLTDLFLLADVLRNLQAAPNHTHSLSAV